MMSSHQVDRDYPRRLMVQDAEILPRGSDFGSGPGSGCVSNFGDPLIDNYDDDVLIVGMSSLSMEEYERMITPVPASKSFVEGLEKLVNLGMDGFGDSVDAGFCKLCLEVIEVKQQVIRMPCSHVFHNGCILNWLEMSHLCPVCSFEMPVDDDDI